MAEHDALADLDLEVAQRGPLRLGEAADLRRGVSMWPASSAGTAARARAIASSPTRKSGGAHPSSRADHSRTAASPRSAMSSRMRGDRAHDLGVGPRDVVAAALQILGHAAPIRRGRSAARSTHGVADRQRERHLHRHHQPAREPLVAAPAAHALGVERRGRTREQGGERRAAERPASR